ncbi:hypothetical protein TNCV_3509931 [Trichonephila clavipes]|nr:hypothetical protein TNCV_3509931 [Trichonephila clavipes]
MGSAQMSSSSLDHGSKLRSPSPKALEKGPYGLATCYVQGKQCHEKLQNYVIPTLQQQDYLQETIFINDGAPPSIASLVQQLLRQAFTDTSDHTIFLNRLVSTIT